MSDDVLVRVENVSKRFCRSLKRSLWYGVQDLGSELGGRRHGGGGGLPQSSEDVELRKDEFWAVKDVSFELRRGECLGLIGRNGAGKTTLLRMLNGLIKPDMGHIEMRGLTGAVIALGAGFNPILSGRENISTSLSILGINKSHRDQKVDEIIAFSELENFIDTPLQAYSSGMQARLGFAVASSIEADIILLDEVLAVGDRDFRTKCYSRLKEVAQRTAIIIVSHNDSDLKRIASRGLYLERGEVASESADISSLLDLYHSSSRLSHKVSTDCQSVNVNWGNPLTIKINRQLMLSIARELSSRNGRIRISFENSAGECVCEVHRLLTEVNIDQDLLTIHIPFVPLQRGCYWGNLIIDSPDSEYDYLESSFLKLEVSGPTGIYCPTLA